MDNLIMENAEIEFIYNGAKTVIQCNINNKMKDICKKFREKANIREDIAILYSYNGKVIIIISRNSKYSR
jgi:hypothetical protein